MSSTYIPGIYVCEVTEQGIGQTKTGKDQLIFKFRVGQRVQRDSDGNETFIPDEFQCEETCYQVITETEKAKAYLISCLRYAGFEGDDFDDLNLVGSSVRFQVEPNEYNGVTNDRWSMCPAPRAVNPIDGKAKRKLNALFGRQLKDQPGTRQSVPQQTAKPVAAKQDVPAAAQGVSDDEVPF